MDALDVALGGLTPVSALGVGAALSLAAVFLFGHPLANVPLSLVGTNSGAGYNTRVIGYDGARGEFSLLATVCIFAPPVLLLLCALSLEGRVCLGCALGCAAA
eukprot:4144867-Prymnesium_polylepis.1